MSGRAGKIHVSFLFCAALVLHAQVTLRPPHSQQIPTTITPKTTTQQPVPCYEVAGVSKAAIERRRSVAQEANAQVEAVCANASLTPQQRAQEISRIRKQESTELNSIITPQQQEAIKECNQARHPSTGVAAPHPGGIRRGPCGEVLGGVGTGIPHPGPAPGAPIRGTSQPATPPTVESQVPRGPQP